MVALVAMVMEVTEDMVDIGYSKTCDYTDG